MEDVPCARAGHAYELRFDAPRNWWEVITGEDGIGPRDVEVLGADSVAVEVEYADTDWNAAVGSDGGGESQRVVCGTVEGKRLSLW